MNTPGASITSAPERAKHWLKQAALSPWLIVAIGPIVLLGPRLLQGEVLFWGTPLLQFIPWRSYGFEAIGQGFLPLWNPLAGMGAPLLANYQSAFFYPLNVLLTFTDIAWGHGLLVLIHLLLAAWGMVALSRRLGLSKTASAIAGLSFSLSGYLVSRSGFFSINAAASWLPWILWALEGWRNSKGWAPADLLPAAAFLWLQWLAGHAQTAWYSLLLAIVWLTWRTITQPESRSIRTWLRLAAPFSLAFLLAAPQLLPTLEYLAHSQRAGSVDPALALTYSFWPWRLLELIFPGIFGHPANGDYWGYANYWEDALYLGTLPLLLAIGGIISSARKRSDQWRLGRFLTAVAALSFLFSLGNNTPVFPWLMRNVPTFNLFQAPTRWNLLLTLSLSLLAALGYERWQPAQGRALYWLRLATAGAAAVSGGAWLADQLLPAVRESFLGAFTLSGFWLLLAGGLGLLLRSNKRAWWKFTVVAVVLADLLLATAEVIPMTEPGLYAGKSALASRVQADQRTYIAADVEYDYTFNRAFRFDSFHALSNWSEVRDVGLPNSLMLDGLHSANNFDPLLPARYQRWMSWLNELNKPSLGKMLSLMDVGLASTEADANDVPIYRPMAGPQRLRWFSEAITITDPEAVLAYLASPEFDPSQQVVLEAQPDNQAESDSHADFGPLATLGPNRYGIEIEANGAGWLLIANSNFPGWRATLDGASTKLFQADYLFQALLVPAGQHQIVLSYQPASIRIGFGLFALGALICLALLATRRWR